MTVDYIWQIMPSLLKGAELTLSLFFLTLLGSLPLGLIVGLALTAKNRVLHVCIEFYIWLMRGTPLLLQLIFVFYGLPLAGCFDSLYFKLRGLFCRDIPRWNSSN